MRFVVGGFVTLLVVATACDDDTASDDAGSDVIDVSDHTGPDAEADGEVEGVADADVGPEAEAGSCPCMLLQCGGYCIDPDTDVKHCGRCEEACGTDEACVDGRCQPLCNPLEVSTKEGLIALLADLDWVSTSGMMRYATVTEDIEVLSSDLGTGYILVSSVPGISTDGEVVFGFDLSIPDTRCSFWGERVHPLYPSVGYERIVIAAGTSFVADFQAFFSYDYYPGECRDGTFCDVWFEAHWYNCCCTTEPFDWKILTFREIPLVCRGGTPACDGDLAGSDHSRCYGSYEDYVLAGWPDIHEQCVNPRTGLTLFGNACACHLVCDGDIGVTANGSCNECGRCDITGPWTYCGSVSEWDYRCDSPGP